MTDTPDKIEVLDLPEPARTLFRKTRNALDTYVSPYTADGEGYKLGGGTVLAARWIHRNSEDIDLICHPDTESAHFQTDLADAVKRAGGTPIAWGEWSRINFGKNHLDLLKRQPVPAVGHKTAIVDGKDFDRYKVTKFVDATRYTAIPAWRVFGTSRSGRIAAGTPSRRE